MNFKIALTIFFLSFISFGKTDDNTLKEEIYTQINNNFLVTGEKLYYKIYCLNPITKKLSKQSKIGNILLLNSKNEVINKQKVNLTNGEAYGDFFIDNSLVSGTYKLISYTNLMLLNDNIFINEIVIINPFIKKIDSLEFLYNKNIKNSFNNDLISLNKQKFSQRDLVEIKLDSTLINGKYSISVYKKTNTIPNTPKITNYKNSKINPLKNKNITVETRGYTLSGTVTRKDKKGMTYKPIGLSVPRQKINLIGSTNKNGDFSFYIKNLNDNKLNLQILDDNAHAYKINLDDEEKLSFIPKKSNYLKIGNEIINEIKKRAIYTQINRSFIKLKKDSIFKNKEIKKTYDSRIKTIYLDDYKRFKTLKETTIEVLDDVFYSQENGRYKFHVRDIINETDKSLPTLLIINGQIIYSHDDYINFSAYKIKSISLLKEKYIFGAITYQGIMEINLFDENFIPDVPNSYNFSLINPEPKKMYYKEDYSNSKNNRVPDYRTQLYWNPNLDPSKNITFYTSDIKGEYTIEIQGIDKKNKPIFIQKQITVN